MLLDCPTSEPFRRAIFGTTSFFDLWSRPWGVARLLGLRALIPREGLDSTTTTIVTAGWRQAEKRSAQVSCIGQTDYILILYLNNLCSETEIVLRFVYFVTVECTSKSREDQRHARGYI